MSHGRALLANPILLADSYKLSHFCQYPPETEYVYSYVESRGSDIPGVRQTQFFGLQGFLKDFLTQPITLAHVEQAADFAAQHGVPFYREGFEHIVRAHKGYWPVEICAVPEGMAVDALTPMLTIVNTDPQCFWVTSFLETALLRACWYGSTVATISSTCKIYLKAAQVESSEQAEQNLPWMLHDYGARGVSSYESAAIGAAAHLVNFNSTDTMAGIAYAQAFYGAGVCGRSFPASEHSTMTAWGRSYEEEAYRNMLEQFGQSSSLLSVVSDSYDIERAVRVLWGNRLKADVLASKSTLVVRPDSGDPASVVCETIESLMSYFGETTNAKGYRVLPDSVRVLQGDGIYVHSLPSILEAMLSRRLSVDNVFFGMGGGLLQKVTRDTFKFAMKCCAAKVNGYWRDVYKEPKGDYLKRSKRGRVTTVVDEQGLQHTRLINKIKPGEKALLRPVWRNGKLLVDDNFSEIRKRAGFINPEE
jgi:nicotinamide phosphoribosyltransferase